MKKSTHWSALEQHYHAIKNTALSELFENNPQRGSDFSLQLSELYLDYSKNHITEETIALFSALAKEQGLTENIKALYSGGIVNKSEKRAALHTSLRDIKNTNNVSSEINAAISLAQEKMFSLADKLIKGELKNRHGKKINHLVCLGIGGSYLGPKFVIDALHNDVQKGISIHFIANIDPNAFKRTISMLDIEECLFFIASKSFTTLETLSNARLLKQQLFDAGLSKEELVKHFIAATENQEAALVFGCSEAQILPIWDFIGGRFSLWSAIGFPILAAIGKEKFIKLLEGAHQMDQHFLQSPLEKNMPFILGCLSIWYQNFFNSTTRAIIPYDHHLKTFPAFLQQLEMESLGKSVDENGSPLNMHSGAIIWGSEGSNSQHAFHQLLHQGTHFIPCDFLVCKHSATYQEHQNILFAQCLAQSRALMIGNPNNNLHKQIDGNKPSNTLVLNKLSAKALGALIALYEHKVFVQASLLDINPFDQWGVELGKSIGKEIIAKLHNKKVSTFDSSTHSLIQHFNK